jgi:hypothetical protein
MFFTIVLLLLVFFAALVFGQAIGAAIGEYLWPGSSSFWQRCAYCPVRNQAQPKEGETLYEPVYYHRPAYVEPEPYYVERPYDPRYDANAPTVPARRKVPVQQQRKQLPRSRPGSRRPVRRQVQQG